MRKGFESVKKFIGRDWSKAEKLLLSSTLILIGFMLGFVLAPIKKGLSFKWTIFSHNGKHSGNHNGNHSNGEFPAPKKEKRNEKKKIENKEK